MCKGSCWDPKGNLNMLHKVVNIDPSNVRLCLLFQSITMVKPICIIHLDIICCILSSNIHTNFGVGRTSEYSFKWQILNLSNIYHICSAYYALCTAGILVCFEYFPHKMICLCYYHIKMHFVHMM